MRKLRDHTADPSSNRPPPHRRPSATAAAALAVVLYAANNLFAAGIAHVGGHWIDRRGPREPFAFGALLFIAAYVLFATVAGEWEGILAAFMLAGSATGLAEPAESAYVARRLPDRLRGSGFGLLGGIQAGGDLVASGILGALWLLTGPTIAFYYAAAWMTASLLASAVRRLTPHTEVDCETGDEARHKRAHSANGLY